ncbi:hypothetical protein Dsin_019479 [Dipteronia sinensis]|uniref:Protein kinase domain-containing protein n=1 Tax=Dipteronia sinensis TaxID=43782 RepID=A0AAE0A8P4_9ROSI|nr:hypothetical protein Dsin_019479 [Dipteronia sinensis]
MHMGEFGRVFKGWIDENSYKQVKAGIGMSVAIKKLKQDSQQRLKQCRAEVEFLGKFSHPNLVTLQRYYDKYNQFHLINGLMKN